MDVEWLILADAAQVVGSKLYVIGGGWERMTVNSSFPLQQRCAVALAVRVPWNSTNQRHNFEIEIADEDGSSVGKLGGQFEVGRPAGIRPGQDQRIQLATDFILPLEKPGGFFIVARIEGQEMRRIAFYVVAGPMLVAQSKSKGTTEGPTGQKD